MSFPQQCDVQNGLLTRHPLYSSVITITTYNVDHVIASPYVIMRHKAEVSGKVNALLATWLCWDSDNDFT